MSIVREVATVLLTEIKKQPFVWAVTIIAVILPLVVGITAVSENGFRGIQYAEFSAGLILYLTAVKIVLDAVKSPTPFFDDISGLFIKWFMSNITSTVFWFIFIFGFAFLIIPGYIIFIRYSFAPLISLDTADNPIDAFKKSKELVTGIQWKMAAIVAILFVGNYIFFQIGENAGIAGVTISIMFYTALYEWLKKQKKDVVILNSALKK